MAETTPKVQVGTSVTLPMRLAIEQYATEHGAGTRKTRDGEELPEISGVILEAIAEKIGYTLTDADKAGVVKKDAAAAEEARKAADKARREKAAADLKALREKNRASATAALAQSASSPNS